MYERYYGLETTPFGPNPDVRFLCMFPHVREALACLQFGLVNRKGFVVMTGEVGTGKTTLLRWVLDAFNDKVSSAFVFNPRLEFLDFLEFVLTDFGLTPTARTKSAMLQQLNKWLVTRYAASGLCIIVIDEAHHLSNEMLEEIRLLTNLETSSHKLLQIVLSGQPELEQKLRHPSVRQLRQRIAVWCKTVPLTAEQTNSYITERLRIAGATDSIFDPHAVQQIHYFSKGIPRLINLLCDHVLINGYVEQLRPIPARIVDGVAAELEFELFEPNPMLDDLPEIPSEIIPQLDLQDAMEVTVPGKDLA